jgi:hypothetical protein
MEVVRERRIGGEPEGDEQRSCLAAEQRCRDLYVGAAGVIWALDALRRRATPKPRSTR